MSGFGFGYGFHKSSTVVAGYDADAQAYFDAVPNAFDAARKTIINTLVTTLKTDGNWTKLDRLWLYANTTTGNAIIDIKSLSSATLVNSPTFTADQGYTGNGSTMYINNNFTASTDGSQYTLNSAAIGGYLRTNNDSGAVDWGTREAATTRYTYPQIRSGNIAYYEVNGSNSYGYVANTNSTGFYIQTRESATTIKLFKNGSEISSNTSNSNSLSAIKTYSLSYNIDGTASNLSTRQQSVLVIGSASFDQSALYNAIQAYMTSLGTQV